MAGVGLLAKCSFHPWVLLVVSVAYLFGGAAFFTIMEQPHHLSAITRLQMRTGRESFRHQQLADDFVQNVSERLFNNSQFLIFLTAPKSAQVHEILMTASKTYRRAVLDEYVEARARNDWSYWNSLDYALHLLTVLGHNSMMPVTPGGQIFAFWFALLGIPLYIWTMSALVLHVALPIIGAPELPERALLKLAVKLAVLVCSFIAWLLLCALILFLRTQYTYWQALLVSVFAFFTIQTPVDSNSAVYFVPVALVIMALVTALVVQHLQLLSVSTKDKPETEAQLEANLSDAANNTIVYGDEPQDTDVFL